MTVSTVAGIFDWDIKQVWSAVTDFQDWKWRSDIKGIEVRGAVHFTEYSKEGYATEFKVTRCVPYERWELEFENKNMKGHWTGVFLPEGERTRLVFTEEVTAKKIMLRPILRTYIKRQQERYMTDLRKKLAHQTI